MSLEIITSDALKDVQHGFFTRKGGASSGVFDGLNCGFGSSDQADVVKINRARAAQALGLSAGDLCSAHQVHSADVVRVTGPQDSTPPTCDALVTDQPDLALVILTADCQPVLFADAKAGVIGAAHAGWKGAIGGILEATLDEMEALGASRENITAIIGPSISQRAYEVGPEFLDVFLADSPDNARFFANGEGDRYQFDLPAFGLHRLRQAGVGHAEWTRHCTYSDPARFYSYRRSVHRKEADYGRLISMIRL
ncbi:peptidoglycan editing factor PgeF [Celeribacter halophilus]|uniref:peptidoglycan editing factor PgeF n=1 Tax=Celeribacter halophilus TaxID=576117 RepID=UPI001C08791D|nr:peptidoglycan editing factor PgeF [Celeribacter halophilus]MBU2891213.1 peptidoglycan editing factor PgeF [Celeribacter halophilus]MDO6510900.1 peptidoglycan editing factor PgeF [Celeribacter halophilus]